MARNLILFALLAAGGTHNPHLPIAPAQMGGVVVSDTDYQDTYSVLNTDTIRQEAQTSDATADVLACEAGNAYYKATVEIDGADILLCAGIATRSMAVVHATSDTSTITITTTDKDGTYTSTTLTLVSGAPGAGEIQCITSNAVCAGAIVTYLASNVTGVTAEAVAAEVYLIPAATLCSMTLSSADGGGTKFVLTVGNDGDMHAPVFMSLGGTTSGHSAIKGAGTWVELRRGDDSAYSSLTVSNIAGQGYLRAGAASSIFWQGLTELYAPADGQLTGCESSGTNCATLDFNDAANTLTVKDKAGTGGGALTVTGSASVGDGLVMGGVSGRMFSNSSGGSFYLNHASQTPDTMILAPYNSSRSVILCEYQDVVVDFGVALPTDPLLDIQSADATKPHEGMFYSYTGAVSRTSAVAGDNHDVVFGSGTNTNAGDYGTGDFAISTGDTTTDGDTGDVILKTGASGDGTGADAGDIVFQTNGANTRMKVWGVGPGVQLPTSLSAAPAEPFSCDATHEGSIQYADDTDDTSYARVCICANLDGTGYDWRDIGDIAGTACPFF